MYAEGGAEHHAMGRGATGAIAALGDLGASRAPAPGKFTAADGPFRRRAALIISTVFAYPPNGNLPTAMLFTILLPTGLGIVLIRGRFDTRLACVVPLHVTVWLIC